MGELNRIIAIAVDDERLHLYPDLDELRATVQNFTTGPLEFFDLAGRRLAPTYDVNWKLTDLRPTGEPDPAAVRDRMVAVLRRARVEGNQRTPSAEMPDAAPLPPDLADLDLADCYKQMFEAGFGHRPLPEESEDLRDPWHNFIVHGIV